MSAPSSHAIGKEVPETSTTVLIGREEKQGEEAPSNVDTAEGPEARIGQKRFCIVGDDSLWECMSLDLGTSQNGLRGQAGGSLR